MGTNALGEYISRIYQGSSGTSIRCRRKGRRSGSSARSCAPPRPNAPRISWRTGPCPPTPTRSIETLKSFCEHGGSHADRGSEQPKRKFLGLVDTLGGGEYRHKHECGVVLKASRLLGAQTRGVGGFARRFICGPIDALRGALGGAGTRERRTTFAAIVFRAIVFSFFAPK